MQTAVYPGTFDPITNGHLDILERSMRIFDQVVVAIATNPRKQPLFSVEERIGFIESTLGERSKSLAFDSFHGLLVDYCRQRGATCIVRGLRAMADFEYEFQLASMNRQLAPEIETLFMTPDEHFAYVSSSLVREIALLGGDVTPFVHEKVVAALKQRLS